MTSKEFVLWLKGFTEGVHEYNVTPKQWDILKDKLAEVEDKVLVLESPPLPFGVPNPAPIQTLPFIQPYNPNPYKVTCESGTTLTVSSGSSGTIIATPGTTGYITTYNPAFSGSYNPWTTTQWNPSGSNWSYTNNTYRPPYTTGGEDEIIKHHNED
jgi:hypothetical protein